jgi:hypothetical protein
MKVLFTLELFKPSKSLPGVVLTAVYYCTRGLSFVHFISSESLKNHIKSHKNRKIEISILLDST